MHKSDELISVVIPAFNRAASIGDALQSLQRQTHSNWHAFVVDDGSMDDTKSIVRRYAAEDERISLLEHTSRKGAQAARNTGIRSANSRWLAFLDSDDLYLPDSLERRLQCAADHKVEVVHSACSFMTGEGAGSKKFTIPPVAGDVYADVLRGPGPMFQALLVTKAALTSIGLLDESILSYQEWDTAIRLAAKYPFGFVSEPTFLYRLGGSDSISRGTLRTAKGFEQVVSKHSDAMLRIVGRHALASHYSTLVKLYWRAGLFLKALSYATRVLLLDPGKVTKISRSWAS